jgi:hypothetical protein
MGRLAIPHFTIPSSFLLTGRVEGTELGFIIHHSGDFVHCIYTSLPAWSSTLLSRRFMISCWFVVVYVCTVTTRVTAVLFEWLSSFFKFTLHFYAVFARNVYIMGRSCPFSLMLISETSSTYLEKEVCWSLKVEHRILLWSVSAKYYAYFTCTFYRKRFIIQQISSPTSYRI